MKNSDSNECAECTFNQKKVLETQHRIINTLQTLVSYIGMMYLNRESISREEIEKLIKFIRSLASLHSINMLERGHDVDKEGVHLDKVIEAVAQLHSSKQHIEVVGLEQLCASYKKAANLALILNELLDNALRFGKEPVRVTFEHSKGSHFRLAISNATKQPKSSDPFVMSSGLRLVELIAKAELHAKPEFVRGEQSFTVTLDLPNE